MSNFMPEPESILMFKLALFSVNKLTPFAWLVVLGAVLAAIGVLIVYFSGKLLDFEERYGHDQSESPNSIQRWIPSVGPLQPGEALFGVWIWTIGLFENGYYVFLAGMIISLIGAYPFIVAASR